jgi:hypothetical protein
MVSKTVAISTYEAEINAEASATKDALLTLQADVTREIGMIEVKVLHSIKLMEDHSACIAQAESGVHHVRNAERYGVTLRLLHNA